MHYKYVATIRRAAAEINPPRRSDPCKFFYAIRNRVVEGREMRTISAFRGPFPESRWTFSFASPLPCPPASTFLREALVGGPVKGSSGRRKHKRMPDQITVSRGVRLLRRFQNVKISVTTCSSMAAKRTVWPSSETEPGRLAFGYMRNAEGLREPERKVCFTPVELALSRRRLKRSTYERAQRLMQAFT